jgi:hypothetical protein
LKSLKAYDAFPSSINHLFLPTKYTIMKKLFIITTMLSTVFTSCQKETSLSTATTPDASPTALKSSMSTNANNASSVTFDLAGSAGPVDNACTGSPLTILSGTGHVAAHTDSKPWNFTFNLQNVVIQAEDGTIYRGGGTSTYQFPQDYNNTVPWELNNTGHFMLTTAGGGNNISLSFVFKITVNANGVFTVFINPGTGLTCK